MVPITYSKTIKKYTLDKFDAIRRYMNHYIKTGSIETPLTGKGKRIRKENSRYADKDLEDEDLPRVSFYGIIFPNRKTVELLTFIPWIFS